jgi:hypothetical protein
VTLAIRSINGHLSKDGKLSTADSCASVSIEEKNLEAVFLMNAVVVTLEQGRSSDAPGLL